MTPAPGRDEALLRGLVALRSALGELHLPLALPGADQHRQEAARLLAHLDDHLLPRVRQRGAPLLAVIGGSTGAGKSTLVNSLVGAVVSPASVLRPTTRSPVLVHHPDDAAWFTSERVLPGLARWQGDGSGSTDGVRLVAHLAVPRGLALLDAPDIDSVVDENRRLGAQLLGAADLWVFVTTAARYADAVPWDLLAEAAARDAEVGIVLDRLEPHERTAVVQHLGQMLAERELADARLLTVPESRLDEGLLPARAVAEVDAWLRSTVEDSAARERVVQRTIHGSVADLIGRVPALVVAADAQIAHADQLRGIVTTAYSDALATVRTATTDGTMLRGEVLARWQEFVGTGEILRAIETTVSSVRDRITAMVRGRRAPEPVARAIGQGLVDIVHDAADSAAERVWSAWHADPAGSALLDGLRVSRSSTDLRERVADEVRGWQAGVLTLVGDEGAGRRTTARALSLGVNGLGAALMVTIFASTGGLTTAEVGVAGGTALLAQRLLEAVFGDDAVRRLTTIAEDDLARRLAGVLAEESRRATTTLDALDLVSSAGLRGALAAVTVAMPAPVEVRLPAPPSVPSEDPGQDAAQPGGLRRWWRRLWQG
ncbi:ABC transporter [Actinotalea sp.]|uniref:ABC transporter n=1 Tax=Actinotalea sp. TaxID=1872145 RepID=UPI0035677B49